MAALRVAAAKDGWQIARRAPTGRRGGGLRCPLWGERLSRALPGGGGGAAPLLSLSLAAGARPRAGGRRAALVVTCATKLWGVRALVDLLLGPADSREREESVSRRYRRTVFDFLVSKQQSFPPT